MFIYGIIIMMAVTVVINLYRCFAAARLVLRRTRAVGRHDCSKAAEDGKATSLVGRTASKSSVVTARRFVIFETTSVYSIMTYNIGYTDKQT